MCLSRLISHRPSKDSGIAGVLNDGVDLLEYNLPISPKNRRKPLKVVCARTSTASLKRVSIPRDTNCSL